jgi:hypothetical protein
LRWADLKREKEAYWEEASSAQFSSVKNPLRKKRQTRQASKAINLSFVRDPPAHVFRSCCQPHRKRESRHHVSGCETLHSRLRFVADAHRGDGKRFVVHADEKLTAFVELEAAIRGCGFFLDNLA